MIQAPAFLTDRPDGVSDALSRIETHGEIMCSSEFSAPWSIAFEAPSAHVHLVESGSLWLAASGHEPRRVGAGELAFIAPGLPYTIASDVALDAVPIERALASGLSGPGRLLRYGGGGESARLICAQFSFGGMLAPRLLAHLPQVIQIGPESTRSFAWIRSTSRLLVDEVRNPQPGSALMVSRLLDLLFVQIARAWAETRPRSLDWIGGLGDPEIGRALSAIHTEPAHPWTVRSLAALAGLSRSAFATRFAAVVGEPPLRYLARWRLHLGAELLRAGTRVSEVAARVGYGSEAAFTRAFKSQFNITPGSARNGRTGNGH